MNSDSKIAPMLNRPVGGGQINEYPSTSVF